MSLENLVDHQGSLDETLNLFDIATIQHSDQITSQRRTICVFRNKWFWTADFPLYHVENNEVVLYLGRGKDNLIFQNIEEATPQLLDTGNYIPKKEEAEAVIKQETTLKIRLSQLRLIKDNDKWSHIEIDTTDYDKLNTDERALAERAYGQGQEFIDNMQMLKENHSDKVDITILNQDYVRSHTKKNGFICRPARQFTFNFDLAFIFDPNDWSGGMGYSDLWLRGVLAKENAAGDAPKTDYNSAFHTVLNNPQELDKEKASKLLNLLNDFYKNL